MQFVCEHCGGPVSTDGREAIPLTCLDPECRHKHRYEKTPPPRIRLTRRDTSPTVAACPQCGRLLVLTAVGSDTRFCPRLCGHRVTLTQQEPIHATG